MAAITTLLTPFRGVAFARRNVPPPTAVYVAEEDRLLVVNYNSKASQEVEIRARVLTPQGHVQVFRHRQSCRTDRGPTSDQYQLGEGFLIGLVVLPTQFDTVRGQTFVQVEIVRGSGNAAIGVHQLTGGYISGLGWLGWPMARQDGPSEGPGVLRSIVGTDPAAGSQILETVPTLARWRLQAIRFGLTTSAAVGNRTVRLTLDDGANTFTRMEAPSLQAPSTTVQYTWFAGAVAQGFVTADVLMPLPSPCMLQGGYRIGTGVNGFDAGDDFTPPRYVVEEWINEGP
jgi:hypothetical protein